MTAFTLDARLQADCHLLAETDHYTYLLNNNAEVAWFVLVPHVQQTELYELEAALQRGICEQVNHLSEFIRAHFECDKINVASIGNVVSQMHIHVIGRRFDDAWWPDVVWGKTMQKNYTMSQLHAIRSNFNASLPSSTAR